MDGHLGLDVPQPGIKPETWTCALTGNRTCNPLTHGKMLQSTEPHQPGKDSPWPRVKTIQQSREGTGSEAQFPHCPDLLPSLPAAHISAHQREQARLWPPLNVCNRVSPSLAT